MNRGALAGLAADYAGAAKARRALGRKHPLAEARRAERRHRVHHCAVTGIDAGGVYLEQTTGRMRTAHP
jgi:hypothetical protein